YYKISLKSSNMDYSDKDFGTALKEIIEKKKIKLRSLANKTNLNYSYFSKLKKRESPPPISTIELISKGLDIPPEYFMEYRIYKIERILKKNPHLIDKTYDYLKSLTDKEKLKVAEIKKSFTEK
ncbi:MAG: helix-turn-helix domain-containing protein, partial [Actinomycetota bacterium]|nr:helix-turn-helix domain-containing protein [Actinomycetota bacterium]